MPLTNFLRLTIEPTCHFIGAIAVLLGQSYDTKVFEPISWCIYGILLIVLKVYSHFVIINIVFLTLVDRVQNQYFQGNPGHTLVKRIKRLMTEISYRWLKDYVPVSFLNCMPYLLMNTRSYLLTIFKRFIELHQKK